MLGANGRIQIGLIGCALMGLRHITDLKGYRVTTACNPANIPLGVARKIRGAPDEAEFVVTEKLQASDSGPAPNLGARS